MAKHEINLVADQSGLDRAGQIYLKYSSKPTLLEPLESILYDTKVDVMLTGVPAVVGTSKRGTKTFISMEYFLQNSNAPKYFSSRGLPNSLAHEFAHIFDHNNGTIAGKLGQSEMFGGVVTDLVEIDAVLYQQRTIQSLINRTGLPFQIRNFYHGKQEYILDEY